ncbi:MAG: thiosulfate oxidation carrier protein SoxY [Chromatiales bacterium]|jgi:sulfur-oxidizing protein SoxY
MKLHRRVFLSGAIAISALLTLPRALLAAYPTKAFGADNADDALSTLLGSAEHSPSDKITLTAPDIAENGAVVPISVATSLEGAESISVLVEENPQPLVASFDLTPGTMADVSTRIKMGKTSNVIAVVKANGKLYSTSKEVKVTIGGCGG